jgi:hypothetical protein
LAESQRLLQQTFDTFLKNFGKTQNGH